MWSLLAVVAPVARPGPDAHHLHPASFPAPHTHYVNVEAVIPTRDRPTLELMMAVWTPGSYLVREFARHVEQLTARDADGRERAVRSIAKNRWEVDGTGTPTITLGYRVYSREMSVRTNWIDRDFALINGAPTFITVADDLDVPHQVGVELPPGWSRSVTALPPAPGDDGRYLAANFDTLVDSPMVVGNPSVHEFEVDGVPHALVNVGDDTLWDGERAAR